MPAVSARGHTRSGLTSNQENVFNTYLERQSRNEYINLATHIGYDDTNIAFEFYENQIRKLMAESPCPERRLKTLRASCSSQPQETIDLFLAPMRRISTSERIENALHRWRQRVHIWWPNGRTPDIKNSQRS